MIAISLIRHGQVDGEAALYGRTDVSLSKIGEANLALACHCLLSKPDLVISSPLKRCSAYAKHFSQENNIDYQECHGFQEMYFGLLDGVSFDTVYENKQWPLLEAFWKNPKENALPQAESLEAFHFRVTKAWLDTIAELKQSQYKHVAIVCHGGVIRMIIAHILNLDWSSPALFSLLKIDYASLTKIEYASTVQLTTIGQHLTIESRNLTTKPQGYEYIMNKSQSHTLMVQGCTSDAGKSVLVAALCRVFVREGHKVAPFKPQNMALNSAVTEDGGEIGRAQAVQAQAANIKAIVDFNPVLLKPNSDTGAQVIIQGKALSEMEAKDYHHYKKTAAKAVHQSYQRLQKDYQYIFVEGAGSPAEINLRKGDIANMGFAEKADCPVIIIADIDRGGVFAHLVGTLELLAQSEQKRVVGFVINRFRGDIALLQSGLDWLEEKTNKPVLGVLPYLHGLEIAAEDAVETQQQKDDVKMRIVVPVYPRMSNHTDFDALRMHPEIELIFVKALDPFGRSTPLPSADLIILPGSKNVRNDLAFLRQQGWHKDIQKHLRYGGKVWGICGGYQMLGLNIADPLGVEGDAGSSEGLAYLNCKTVLEENKVLANVEAKLKLGDRQCEVKGYEIHAGQSHIDTSLCQPITKQSSGGAASTCEGAMSLDGQISGSYLHGIFDQSDAIQVLMAWAGTEVSAVESYEHQQNRAIDRVADACEKYLDINKIKDLMVQHYS